MADPKTYTEDEHLAVLADRVAKETAELTTKVTELEAANVALKASNDVLEAEKAGLNTSLETERAAFVAFKEELEKAAAISAVTEERAAKVKELTPFAPDFVTPERSATWATMEQAAFDALCEGLEAAKPAAGSAREAAAFSGGAPIGQSGSVNTNKRDFLALMN